MVDLRQVRQNGHRVDDPLEFGAAAKPHPPCVRGRLARLVIGEPDGLVAGQQVEPVDRASDANVRARH